VFQKVDRVRRALRSLTLNAQEALPLVLERRGSLHVAGFGLNTVSEILAANDPTNWPVFNAPVAAALEDFGYKAPRGEGLAERYSTYRNAKKIHD
jgi:hypothetical protein